MAKTAEFNESMEREIEGRLGVAMHEQQRVVAMAKKAALDCFQPLLDLALGVWVEQEIRNKKGELVKVNVYQQPPSLLAIKELYRMGDLDMNESAATLLTLKRGKAADTAKNASEAQREFALSRAAQTKRETEAFDKSYATEEQFVTCLTEVSRAPLVYCQNIPPGEYPRTQDAWNSFVKRLANIIAEAVEEQLENFKPIGGVASGKEDDE